MFDKKVFLYMKKISILLVFASLYVCLFLSCTDKTASALNDLENFTEELSDQCRNYTQEDWDISESQYNMICEELDNYDYTDEELVKIGKLKGRCTTIFAAKVVNDVKESIHRFGKEAEGFFEGVSDEINKNKQEN